MENTVTKEAKTPLSPEAIDAQRFAELRALLSGLLIQSIMAAGQSVVRAKGPEEAAEFLEIYREACLGFLTAQEAATREAEFARLGIADPEPDRLPFNWLARLIYSKDSNFEPIAWPSTFH